MNATFLSSTTGLVAGGHPSPDLAPGNGGAASAFQALLANATGTGQSPSNVLTPNNGEAGQPASGPEVMLPLDKALRPAIARELAQMNPELQNIAQELGLAFGQLRSQLSQLLDALPEGTIDPTAMQQPAAWSPLETVALAAGADGEAGTLSSGTAKLPVQVEGADLLDGMAKPSPVMADIAQSNTLPATLIDGAESATDPLITALEPMRDRLAALGIDIDALQSVEPKANLSGKGKVQIQDIIAAPDNAQPPEDLATPVASPPLERIINRLESLKDHLAQKELPAEAFSGLEQAVSRLRELSGQDIPAQVLVAAAATPPATTQAAATQAAPFRPATGVTPATSQAAAPMAAPQPEMPISPAAPEAPLATAKGETPAAPVPAGVELAKRPTSPALAPQATAQQGSATAQGSPAAPEQAPQLARSGFDRAPVLQPAVQAAPAANANASAPVTPAPVAPAMTSSPDLAAQMSDTQARTPAATAAAQPSSAPGAQLSKRNEKSAGIQNVPAANGATAKTASAPSVPAGATASPAPAAQPDMVSTEPRPITPLPLQAGLDGQPLQSVQAGHDTAMTLKPEQDLGLQRADGRVSAENRAAPDGPRFTPHSAQHLAAQISRRFNNGARVFDIRLDPAELGRVDVRLELSGDQRVQAMLSVERPETLAELQRNARELERALADAGLEVGENGLEFQLNENADDHGFNADEDADVLPVFAQSEDVEMASLTDEPAVERDAYGFRLAASRDRLDMRI